MAKTRTYYLLFDGKTIVCRRPDVRAKALVQAANKIDASVKFGEIYDYDPFKGVFTTRKAQIPKVVQAPRACKPHSEFIPHALDPKKIYKDAEGDSTKGDPSESDTVLDILDSLEPQTTPASECHAIVFEGIRLLLPKDTRLMITTEGDLIIQAPIIHVNEVQDL